MQFKDIKQNYPVYILNTEEIKAINGKVINVSQPYFPPSQQFPSQQSFSPTNTQRMIDLTIEYDGRTQTFSVPETSQVVNAPKMVISTDRDGVIREVEAIKSTKEERLKSREKDESDVKACEDILANWNPEFAAKKEQEKRLSMMEDKIGNMEGKIGNVENLMKKLYESLNGGK